MPYDLSTSALYSVSDIFQSDEFPLASILPVDQLEALFADLFYTGSESWVSPAGQHINFRLAHEGLIGFELPGLTGISILAAATTDGWTSFGFRSIIGPEPALTLANVPVTLRVSRDYLQPMKSRTEIDHDKEAVDIDIAELDLRVSLDGVEVDGEIRVDLPLCMIGETGVLVSAQGITVHLDDNHPAPGRPPGWRGIHIEHATLDLPGDLGTSIGQLGVQNAYISSGGFTGQVSSTWEPEPLHAKFLDFDLAVRKVEIAFEQNALTKGSIQGTLQLPFFDSPIGVEISLSLNGGFLLSLAAVQPPGVPQSGSLVIVEKPGLLRFAIDGISLAVDDGVATVALSGEITPLFGIEEPPKFKIQKLAIDSKGKVHLEGGWLGLREKYIMKFHGFQLEISKLGFGNTENGGKWIGFTGGVKLVAGMPAGASAEGLRITWYPDGHIDTSLEGVRVNFEVPNTLKFDGEVSFHNDPAQGAQFRGEVKLDLIALRIQVDATAVFQMKDAQPCLAIYLSAEFPAGIPLFATGLGVYGMAGLFALNMEPNRLPNQEWYALGSQDDWYHKSPAGVTSLAKWTAHPGSMAFGAGVTLGTVADNGHTFSGKMLLAIVFPGPILLIQGSASLLKERTTLSGDDANFRALAVLDGRAGTFQVGLDAQYRYDDSGKLIDIHGAAEGYFNFNDPSAWRLNVGLKEPRDRRLTARLFNLFDSYSYLTLDAQQLAMGAWVGFKQQWQFGPLNVGLEAWIDGNARVSWKPAHFYGDMWLHGSAKLSVFGFSAGLTVDAKIAADVFDPLHVVGNFNVAIDLPWPLSDITVGVKLEWGPQPTAPPLPLPLKEVAIEHFKATTSWPLPRKAQGLTPALLLPNYDGNEDGFFEGAGAHTPPVGLPVVPLDSRPHITFARNINDDALVGVNAQRISPEFERIGNPVSNQGPARVRYGLDEVALEKLKKNGQWEAVARKAKDANSPGVPTLFGSWAPVPQMPGGGGRNVGQTKLWLWSKTPFEYTRHSSRAWDEWFSDEYSGYPCQSLPSVGWDFENIEPTTGLPNPWRHPDEPNLQISSFGNDLAVVELSRPSHGLGHAFSISGPGRADILLPRPTNLVRVMLTDSRFIRVSDFRGHGDNLKIFPATLGGTPDRPYIEIRGQNIVRIHYFPEVFLPVKLATGLAGAIGGAYIPTLHKLIFVEFVTGNVSTIDLLTGDYTIIGKGYTEPEDIVVTADGATAYVTERSGSLLRLDLTSDRSDRDTATLVTKDMLAPNQIALDEEGGQVFVVEYDEFGSEGRLLSIALDGPNAGSQTVIAAGLEQAVGLLMTSDLASAYVSEQARDGRLTRISLIDGSREIVASGIPAIFFLRWANAEQDAIVTVQRDPENMAIRIDLKAPGKPIHIMDHLPFRPSSVVILPDDRYVVCSDEELTIFTISLLVPKICDVGGNLLVRHFEDEFARWREVGDVLEPHSTYRLKVKTSMHMLGEGQLSRYKRDESAIEYAYFRTDGPPGVTRLTAPMGSERISSPGDFKSPLDDLSRYVRKTLPGEVLPTPDSPVPSRLYYRAYDVGIEFDENYVDLMYRLGRRDLAIHLYDGNGAIRDEMNRRLILANEWGRAEEVTLTEREERWLSVLGSSGCTLIPVDSIVTNSTFKSSSAAHVLPPATMCEARLVPALLHDDFGGYKESNGANGPNGSFERWQVRDNPGSPASAWKITSDGAPPDFALAQTNVGATSTLVLTNAPDLDAAHPDQPASWTDYRLTAHLRSETGRIGVVWRYRDANQHYRFVMDGDGKCEVFRVVNGEPASLVTGSVPVSPDNAYVIKVEVVGSTFIVSEGTTRLFSITDATSATGGIGLYSSGNPNARFTDVVVDDLRATAPVVYRFSLRTSRFKNFVDQLGSFENKMRRTELLASTNVAPQIAAAAPPSSPPSDNESRAYDSLLTLLPDVAESTPRVCATRVKQSGNAIAFLVQSPEPLDWKRIHVQLLYALLPSTSYNEVQAKVLRKADGGGLLIVSPAAGSPGSLLPPGEYRVVFTYRRDNRVVDQNSELLSEAGQTTPEVATLDLPSQISV